MQLKLKPLQIESTQIRIELCGTGAISLPLLSETDCDLLKKEAESLIYKKLPEFSGPQMIVQDMSVSLVSTKEVGLWKLGQLLAEFANNRVPQLAEKVEFNEIEALYYRANSKGLEAHRDREKYVNLIALVNLTGGGRFYTCQGSELSADPVLHRTNKGDVVFMRGYGFAGLERPKHFVDGITDERIVCSYRQLRSIR